MKTNKLFCKLQKFNNAKKINPLFTLLITFLMTFSTIGQTFIVESDCVVGPYPNLSFEFETQNTTGVNLGAVLSNGVILESDWRLLVIEADPNDPIVYFDANNPGLGTNYTKWVLQENDGTSWFFTIDETFLTAPCDATWVVDTIVGGGRPCTTENLVTYCTGVTPTWYEDFDGDGFGNSLVSLVSESKPDGYVLANDEAIDCNDNDLTVNPGATEIEYDGKDNDCNIDTPDDDLDNDGFDNADDCDDTNPDVNSPITYYVDADLDGFGDPNNSINICDGSPPDGYVTDNTDCFDNGIGAETAYPGATEIPGDLIDNDCDDDTDEDDDQVDMPVFCNEAKTKVLICHNGKDKCVSINALPAHLAHGDTNGSCDANARSSNQDNTNLNDSDLTSLKVISWPNPTNNQFNITIKTPNLTDKVYLQAFDINGRIIHADIISANQDYKFGEKLGSGLYFIKISQADMTQSIKVIKH